MAQNGSTRRFMMSTAVYTDSRRIVYERLNWRCTGMEFATEMIIKSSLYGECIGEVPITLHRDGRTAHRPSSEDLS